MSYVPVKDEDVLPKQYKPDWEALKVATSESQFSEASFYLLREGAQLTAAIAGMKPRTPITSRNEATLLGLVVKVTKLTKGILRDASDGEIEQQLSMFRELVEAIANLRWLMRDDGSGERYAMLIEAGLGAEKSMLVTIAKNIDERSSEALHIEKRMVVSITDTLKAAGIEDVSSIRSGKELAKQGFPRIEKRIEELGKTAYFAYRASSAGIHTTWSDLFKHHLEYDGVEFGPDLSPPRRRPQALTTVVALICTVMPEYVDRMFEEYAAQRVLPLLENLSDRTAKLTKAHEDYLTAKGEPKGFL
jgi:hypothetical protein